MPYLIEDIAQEIYVDLDEPSDLSVGAIKFFLRGKVGDLNNLLFATYTLNGAANEISPSLGEDEKSILKSLYMVYYYNRMIRNNLGAAAFSSVVQVSSDGGTVRLANQNEIAKSYLQMVRDEKENLKTLINSYRVSKGSPSQVTGVDSLIELPVNIDSRLT